MLKNRFVLCASATLVLGCGGSKSTQNPESAVKNDLSKKLFLSSNVILGLESVALAQTDSTYELDTSTKIRPEQIVLSENESRIGRLKSKNLKTALENEIAPDLTSLIRGKTWKIESLSYIPSIIANEGGVSITIDNPAQYTSSTITFSTDGTFEVSSGCAFIIHGFACKSATDGATAITNARGTYKVIDQAGIIITGSSEKADSNGGKFHYRAFLQAASFDNQQVILVNDNSGNIGLEVNRLTVSSNK